MFFFSLFNIAYTQYGYSVDDSTRNKENSYKIVTIWWALNLAWTCLLQKL